MMVCATVMFAGCNKDGNNEPTPAANGGGQTAAGWVDLGLPSGLLWATCNLGATSPDGYGDYYAWGETATKDVYGWSTYKYCNGTTMTKYCNNSSYGYNGFTDNLTTLEAMDDAAAQKLGAGARMPTAAEWRELIYNTTAEWTQVNGVNGRKFTAANGNSLFLPAAGVRDGSGLYNAGLIGFYWSSSLYGSYYPGDAWGFNFNPDDQGMGNSGRYIGLSVRAVRSQN